MSEVTTDSSGEGQESSGANLGEGQSGGEQSVSYETHKRLLAEKKRGQEQLLAMQAQLAEIEAARKAGEEKKLSDNEEYKKLLDLKAGELDTAQTELTRLRESQVSARKLDSFLSALGGKVDRKYWGLVDLNSIAANPDTGEIDEMSVTKSVEAFRADHGRLIDTPSQNKSVGSNFPKGSKGATDFASMTAAEKLKATAEFMVANKH